MTLDYKPYVFGYLLPDVLILNGSEEPGDDYAGGFSPETGETTDV